MLGRGVSSFCFVNPGGGEQKLPSMFSFEVGFWPTSTGEEDELVMPLKGIDKIPLDVVFGLTCGTRGGEEIHELWTTGVVGEMVDESEIKWAFSLLRSLAASSREIGILSFERS